MVACHTRVLAALALFALAHLPSAVAQGDDPPVMEESILLDMPSVNGIPGKDDPASRVGNDASLCGMGEDGQVSGSDWLGDEDDTGEPVGLHNGMVSYRAVDLVLPGRGIDYELTRRYNSKRSEVNGPLGYGWDHNFNIWLEIKGANRHLWNGNNREAKYTPDGSGGFIPPRGIFSKLTYDSATQIYTLRARHGSKTRFETVTVGLKTYGRLLSITDRNGNALTMQYFASGTTPSGLSRLRRVIDSMGRAINYNYDGQGRVNRVTDFAGREVIYTYDAAGNLATARSPKVLFACFEHLAPQGRIERYRYYSGTGLVKIDHNLWQVVRPNQGHSNPNGAAALTFNYNQNSGNWRYDWCTSQVWGDVDGSVGGTISYSYASVDVTPPGSPTLERLETTVTDRRGEITTYRFNEYGHCLRITETLDLGGPAVTKFKYDTSVAYISEGLITEIEFPRGNKEQRTYVTTGARWQQGNVAQVKYLPGSIPSDQTERVLSYVWEPVSNHLHRVTDENGSVREFLYDWMEGGSTAGAYYVADDVAAELGITIPAAEALINSFLTGLSRVSCGCRCGREEVPDVACISV